MDVYLFYATIMKFIILSDYMLFPDSSSSFTSSDFLQACILIIVTLVVFLVLCI